ncbi:hypothetical protein [Azospirillum sp. B4]|uniref:hypothetical protein n=1 Tax=Azospirillum sp. B4 TaxID=95605 RepID=UPI000346F201|nr:hypothetical protein [Azospirillum sp. B4]
MLASVIAAFFLALVTVGYGLVSGPVALSAAHEAMESGVLRRTAWLPLRPGATIPVYAPNDCLILSMLVIPPRDGIVKAAVSPQTPGGPAEVGGDSRLPDAPQCQGLGRLLSSMDSGSPLPELAYYHRYIHAYRVAMAGMLRIFSFNAASLILLAATVLPLAYLLVQASRGVMNGEARGLPYAALATILLMFSGVGVFDFSFSFAPTDILTYLYLVAAYHGLLTKAPARLFSACLCIAGALIADFEFLTGAIPSFISAFLLTVAIDAGRLDQDLRRKLATGFACFCLTVAASFGFKILLVSVLWGPSAYLDFGHQLMTRLGSAVTLSTREAELLGPYGITEQALASSRPLATAYALVKPFYFGYMLAYGSEGLGVTLIILAFLAGAAATFVILRRSMAKRGVAGGWLYPMACGIAPLWYASFPNHSIEHAFFMVRILAWSLAASGVMVAALLLAPRMKPSVQ